MKFHFVKVERQERTGRAKRGTDTTAKKYHLTGCGLELTERELHLGDDAEVCSNCARASYEF